MPEEVLLLLYFSKNVHTFSSLIPRFLSFILHSDRMDYRRIPATGEAGKRAEKTGKESEAVRTPLAAQKIPPAEKVKKETWPERGFFHKKEEYSRKQNIRVEALSEFL